MIPVAVLGTASVLAGRRWSNDDVGAWLTPPVPGAVIGRRTGIEGRWWMDREQRLADVGVDALRGALQRAGLPAEALTRVLFASSGGGDWVSPPTAGIVAASLGIAGRCDAYDVNAACTAFLVLLEQAARYVATGGGPVGLVIVEKNSDLLDPADARTGMIFGDAAVAAVVGPAAGDEGLLAHWHVTDFTLGNTVFVPHGRWDRRFAGVQFGIGGAAMADGVVDKVGEAVERALTAAGLRLQDVDWVLPHQPNGLLFDRLVTALGVDPAKTVSVVRELGSLGGAAVPVSLDRLLRTRPVRPGHTVLMTAIGGGVSYGASVLRLGTSGITNDSP